MSHGVDDVLQAAVGQASVLVKRPFVDDAVSNIIFVKYYALASATLLYFDFFVTFPDEVRRIWNGRLTAATVFFVLNRYVPLIGYVFILLSLFNPPWSIEGFVMTVLSDLKTQSLLRKLRCDSFAQFPGSLNTFAQCIISIVLVLRTYALYNRCFLVLMLTIAAGSVNVGISAWATSAMVGNLFDFPPIVACVPILQDSFKDRLRYGWIATFSFDLLIFILTISRSYVLLRKRRSTTLAALLMRDGSLFFLVMSTVNALNFALFATLTNPFFASTTGTNSFVAHVVSVSLLSRLMLNLREESHHHRTRNLLSVETESAGELTDTRLVFTTRILGNLTSGLITGSDEQRELDDYYFGQHGRRSDDDDDDELQTTASSVYSGRPIAFGEETRSTFTVGSALTAFSARPTSKCVSRTGSYVSNTNTMASGSGVPVRLDTTLLDSDLADAASWYEKLTPATVAVAVVDGDDGVVHPLRHSSSNGPLSPLSAETCVESAFGEYRKSMSDEDEWRGPEEAAASGLSLEMTRLERRRNSFIDDRYLESGEQEEDLYHDHYRTQTDDHTQRLD